MAVRDLKNKTPVVASSIIAALIFLMIGYTVVQMRGNRPPPPDGGLQRYYTTDDGRTWFADAWGQIPPFDHNGSPAVRCYVFKTASSAPFAGYLEKYTPQMHDELDGTVKVNGPVIPFNGELVKRPGDKVWVPEISPAGQQVMRVKSPDGSTPESVSP